MRCVAYPDPAEFVAATIDFLDAHPYFTNAITTNAIARSNGQTPLEAGAVWVSVQDDDGRTCGAAMRTPPRGVLMSPMPLAAIDALVPLFADTGLPKCDGPRDEVRAFAERYAAASGCAWEIRMDQRLLVLHELLPARPAEGRCRPATLDDADVVVAWVREFAIEATPGQPHNEPEAVRRRLATPGSVWIWEADGTPRSLCWQSSPAAGIVRISLVYTPPEQRGHGYASANVATVTRMALDAGAAACMLYTDQANPTSNKVYEAIGYSYTGDAAEVEFVSPR